MGKYDWLMVINLIAWGYLFLLLIDICRKVILCGKRNEWRTGCILQERVVVFKTTYGIGSISIILFALAFVWLSKCDEILRTLNMPSWSNGNMGNHIGSYYALLFFVPAYLVGYKYRKDFGAELFMKLSGLFSAVYITYGVIVTIYQ